MNSDPHILVVHKKSAYEKYVLEEHDEAVARLVAAGDISVASLKRSHAAHTRSLDTICEHLSSRGLRFEKRYRGEVDAIAGYDLVVAVGGDGTVLDISHRITDTPLLAINSDPQASIGYFCAGKADDFPDLIERTVEGDWEPFELGRFRARINNELTSVPVLNDVLITHSNPAAVSHYLLTIDDNAPEEQKSSGIWVSTPAGSTAAIRWRAATCCSWTAAGCSIWCASPIPCATSPIISSRAYAPSTSASRSSRR